jgi:NAD(P)H-flavin reductase
MSLPALNANPLDVNPMLPNPYLVRSVAKETHDTFTLRLEPEAESVTSSFLPGQFSMLYVFGVGEVPISISGDPGAPGQLVYTIRSVGKTTRALTSQQPGKMVGVRGPFGTNWPVEDARGKDVILVAGGIGLAPLRPVIYHILHNRSDYGRLFVLYGARTVNDLLYRKELAAWEKQPDTRVYVTVDTGSQSWRGNVGVVTSLFRFVEFCPSASLAMLCGPEIMMRFVVRELESRGLKQSHIYLSMERNVECALGFCGHCQYGPYFICKDGPVFSYDRLRPFLERHEL